MLRAYYKDKPQLVQLQAPLGRIYVRRRFVANARLSLTSPTTADHVVADQAVFVMDTSRHRWVLEPLLGATPSGRPPARVAPRRLPVPGVTAMSRRGVELADAFVEMLIREEVVAPLPIRNLYDSFLTTLRYLATTDRMLDELRPRAVVIATNHNIPSRALAFAARRHGIPTVFFPHAPMIRDERFSDIPADFAGMRGEAEIDRLVALNVGPDRLEVVGDPSLDVLTQPPIDPDGPVAFALPSILTDEEVRVTVEWVRAAAGDNVVVSPHPRQGEAYARRFAPEGWTVWNDRTMGLLRKGPPVVIQQSSGVAVESMLLGLPTLQIDLPQHQPNYPALDPEHVRFIGSADQAVAAVADARADSADAERSQAIVDWGRRWSAYQGAEAVERSWAVIQRAVTEGATPAWLNDAWSRV